MSTAGGQRCKPWSVACRLMRRSLKVPYAAVHVQSGVLEQDNKPVGQRSAERHSASCQQQ